MLNQEELKEIATLQADGSYFVSLYLNVSPGTKQRREQWNLYIQ